MERKHVLCDILEHFAQMLHRTIKDLPDEAMQWQPDPQANNIGVTVWHVSRSLDVLKVKLLENRLDEDQLWVARGWASCTGYAPAGLGIGGFGNLAGYTLEQVRQVPALSAGEHLKYFDQVYTAIDEFLAVLDEAGLQTPPAGWPRETGSSPEDAYSVILAFLLDNREHLGEIKAIKAMWSRKFVQAPRAEQ